MNIFNKVLELWPGHGLLYGIKSRGNNSKTKTARVVFLVHDTSSYCDVCTCEASRIYSISFWSYGLDTKVGLKDC